MTDLSSAERLALLKLHHAWPDRTKYRGSPGEALLFFRWLQSRLHDVPEAALLGSVESVQLFMDRFQAALFPSAAANTNLRREPRIESEVKVMLRIAASHEPKLVGQSTTGVTIDLGLHGLRIRSARMLPDDGALDIFLTPNGLPRTVFSLSGEPRWVSSLANEAGVAGILIRQGKDFKRWHNEFGMRFGSAAARSAEGVRPR